MAAKIGSINKAESVILEEEDDLEGGDKDLEANESSNPIGLGLLNTPDKLDMLMTSKF